MPQVSYVSHQHKELNDWTTYQPMKPSAASDTAQTVRAPLRCVPRS